MSLRKLLATMLLAGTAGCDVPTSLPSWTTEWDLLAVDQKITTPELLPASVRADAQGFVIDSFAAVARVRLGDVCELCTCFDGPIPELTIAPHDWPVRLPPGLIEAQLRTGKARLVLVNEIGFDLLDDGLGNQGWLDVLLVDRYTDAVIERRLVTGTYPAGASLALEFDLRGRRLHSGLVARVSGHTPGSGGCIVPLDESSGFTARVELHDVVASSVDVIVSDAQLALAPRSLELPSALARRLRPGEARVALNVEVESRVPTSAELDLSVGAGPDLLFTRRAALHTPMVLPSPTGAASADARGLYLLGLEGIPEAGRLHFAARTRITGSRIIRLRGSESLEYRLRVHAEVPTR
jgi:hypothetical protein